MPDEVAQDERVRLVARVLLYSLAVLAFMAIVALGFAAIGVVEPDVVCGLCHAPSAAALDDGVHAAASCYQCHARPGSLGRIERLLLDVGRATAGLPDGPLESRPFDDACLACHNEILMVAVRSEGLVMSHGACIDDSLDCMSCHSDVGHGLSGPGRTVNMDTCARCHDGIRASKECDTCHEGDSNRTDDLNAWALTHSGSWLSTHGMGSLSTCGLCHDSTKCSKCHLPLPHPASWPRTHGPTSVDAGIESCSGCHEMQLCSDCHGIEMPHPVQWLQLHVTDVRSKDRESRCGVCHSKADCTNCHEAHAHPGLSSERIEELNRR